MSEKGNLPPQANPCCGHVTDASAAIERPDNPELPNIGDIALCINCGAILVYVDPERNITRYARRIEIETIPREDKRKLTEMQKFIRYRGWIPQDARRRDGN